MIKEKLDWVKDKLTHHPELRDSNERLYYHYLLAIGFDVNMSFKDALKAMESRTIPYLDSIGRASRKVQEMHPHLQGEDYKKRKKKEEEVREEIKSI
jgi:hypothetical protein